MRYVLLESRFLSLLTQILCYVQYANTQTTDITYAFLPPTSIHPPHIPNPCYWGSIRRQPLVQPVYNKTACLQYLFLIFFKLLTWITTFSSVYFDSFFFASCHVDMANYQLLMPLLLFAFFRAILRFSLTPPPIGALFLCSIICYFEWQYRVCAAVYVRLPNGLSKNGNTYWFVERRCWARWKLYWSAFVLQCKCSVTQLSGNTKYNSILLMGQQFQTFSGGEWL